jgi:predicted regulator of Ras-like GTPase activity (Roadblock/LC7/MglB family)
MSNALVPLLRSLRDIEGVLGSFVMSERGELLVRDAPAAAGSDVLTKVGGRLRQLGDAFAFADIGAAFESTTLTFREYKLHVRSLGKQFVVVLLSSEVNLPALRMALNMLSRRLQVELAAARVAALTNQRSSQVSPAASSVVTSDRSGRDALSEDSPQRSYRGRRFSR